MHTLEEKRKLRAEMKLQPASFSGKPDVVETVCRAVSLQRDVFLSGSFGFDAERRLCARGVKAHVQLFTVVVNLRQQNLKNAPRILKVLKRGTLCSESRANESLYKSISCCLNRSDPSTCSVAGRDSNVLF